MLTVVYGGLVPPLVAAYAEHRERCTIVADANVIRTLDMILADLIADTHGADALRAIVDAQDEHASVVADVVAAVSAAGGIVSP